MSLHVRTAHLLSCLHWYPPPSLWRLQWFWWMKTSMNSSKTSLPFLIAWIIIHIFQLATNWCITTTNWTGEWTSVQLPFTHVVYAAKNQWGDLQRIMPTNKTKFYFTNWLNRRTSNVGAMIECTMLTTPPAQALQNKCTHIIQSLHQHCSRLSTGICAARRKNRTRFKMWC